METGRICMGEKVDRRVRKTKAALRAGLMELMQKKSIREITVSELVEKVDINRSTFYLHYNDIYDMLAKIEEELINELMTVTIKHKNEYYDEKIQIYLTEIFTILLDNMDICNLLMSPHGDIKFINNVKYLIKEKITQTTIEVLDGIQTVNEIEYACSFYIGGCLGIVEKWLTEGTKETPGQLATLCYKLIYNGLEKYIPTA